MYRLVGEGTREEENMRKDSGAKGAVKGVRAFNKRADEFYLCLSRSLSMFLSFSISGPLFLALLLKFQ